MKNNKYWSNRMVQLELNALKKGAEYYKNLQKQYDAAIHNISNDIMKWYVRLAENNEVSLSEAMKLLGKNELDEFKWTLKDYIGYGEANAVNQEWMKELENASAKYHISRLEAMKIQMKQHLERLANEQEKGMSDTLSNVYEDTYYHTAYEIQKGLNVGINLEKIDTRKIEEVLSTGWATDGKNFSDRIWTNKEKLANVLNNTLTQMIIRGEAPDKAIKAISATMGVSKNQAGRLVMTESAMIASVSQKDCFKDLNVEEFEIVSALDMTTCDTCGGLDGTHLPMKDFIIGETAPPFHVNCRCTTTPYFADDEGTRIARDEEGKSYYVPSNIKYKEWKEKYVNANPEVKSKYEAQRKMHVNYKSDKEQYEKYKKALGTKEVGRSFAKFQEMKYNNVEEWKNLKAQYSDALGIRTEKRAKEYIENVNKTINEGKQDKHIKGSNNYIEGKSYLTISKEEAQELVNKYAGTGKLKFGKNEKWDKKEIIYTNNKIIGVAKSMQTGEHKTSNFKIHYSKNGVHIVPFWKEE